MSFIFTGNCSENSKIRLVNGESPLEGRVEICLNGVWGTVSSERGWDYRDASVACRQLNFSSFGM